MEQSGVDFIPKGKYHTYFLWNKYDERRLREFDKWKYL